MSDARDLVGKLLVASTTLEHPSFWRTVILVLDHDEDGALGVIVNRPSEVPVDSVLPGWETIVSAPNQVFNGGPVSGDSALALAKSVTPAEPPWLRRVSGEVAMVDLDSSPTDVAGTLDTMRIFAGYAGWSAGQLSGEISEGSWHVVDALPGDAFSPRPELLWHQVLARQGGDMALLATFPDDPSHN